MNLEDLLKPVPKSEHNPEGLPAGIDITNDNVIFEIEEAARSDFDVKQADWKEVFELCHDTLKNKSKDLQIAIHFIKALIHQNGFNGLSTGLSFVSQLLGTMWEHVYPTIENNNATSRLITLENLDVDLIDHIFQIPLTNTDIRLNYYQWTDRDRKEHITGDEYDKNIEQTISEQPKFYLEIQDCLCNSLDEIKTLNTIFDKQLSHLDIDAPRLIKLEDAILDCQSFINKILKKNEHHSTEEQAEGSSVLKKDNDLLSKIETISGRELSSQNSYHHSFETSLWNGSLKLLKEKGLSIALEHLFSASSSAHSVRQQSRYALLISKLCLEAKRSDLAKPILESLNSKIQDLELEKWESPEWIADVWKTYYECLKINNSDNRELSELFIKICKTDITKAVHFSHLDE